MIQTAQEMLKEVARLRADASRLTSKANDLSQIAFRMEHDAFELQRQENAKIPVDRTQQTLVGGAPVTPDHREPRADGSGMQKAYVVLSEAERAKGFVRPVRYAYRHMGCDMLTTMSRELAETYARDPGFYSGTYCRHCCNHFPVGEDGEFIWDDGTKVGT